MSPTAGVLREASGMYKAHWRHLLPIAFVVYALVAVVSGLLAAALTDWLAAIFAAIVGLVGGFWLQGALVQAIADVRDGRADLTVADTFQKVIPKIGPIAVASVGAGIAIALGLVLLIAPGLILLTWWILIVPAIVLENRGAGESFGRSRELVRGHGWNVFGVIVLTILVLIGASILIGLVLAPFDEWLQNVLGDVVSGTLIGPFLALAWTLLYYRLREHKEVEAGAAEAPAAT